jgi:hypothetical protein
MRHVFWYGQSWIALPAFFAFACLVSIGCATPPGQVTPARAFDFERDTFAYTNNNYWVYDLDSDPSGTVVTERLEDVDHGQRCTVMSRTSRQFFYGARFEKKAPKLAVDDYRHLIRSVLSMSPRLDEPTESPVIIPGYADLRSLSVELEAILKEELRGRWTGYLQRGNWRMIFAFSPSQNRATARELVEDARRGHLPLVHVVNYPAIDINHTVLIFDYEESPLQIRFELYDPNNADNSGYLVFDRASATFSYNRTDYFAGGSVQVYEIYDGILF